jgi:protein phosphatase
MSRQRLSASSRTHQGRIRTNNEDAFVCKTEAGLFAVIDGIGGEEAGEVAADIAAKSISAISNRPSQRGEQLLKAAFHEARRKILAHAKTLPEGAPGAVATAVRLEDNGKTVVIAHAGDTRCWQLKNSKLTRLTVDHVQPVPGKPGKAAVARDLGRADLPEDWVELKRVAVEPGELLLMASDGLYDVVPEEELEAELNRLHDTPVDAITSRLMGLALARGGPDNITIIAVRIGYFRRRRLPARLGIGITLGVFVLLLLLAAGIIWKIGLPPRHAFGVQTHPSPVAQ